MIFNAYDLNFDGYLNHYEVKVMLAYSYGSASDADAEWFINLVDSNYDNKISRRELYSVLQ